MSKQFYIKIKNTKVDVSEQMYRPIQIPECAFTKRTEREKPKTLSYDNIIENGKESELPDLFVKSIEEIIANKLLFDLRKALNKLSTEERKLIDDIFYYEKTEQEIANKIAKTQQAISKRKKKILVILKNIIKIVIFLKKWL